MAASTTAEGLYMKRLAVALIGLGMLIPAGSAFAEPDDISGATVAKRGALRIGNAEQVVPAPEPPTPRRPEFAPELVRVLELINQERVSRGLVPVRMVPQLNDAALTHTERQAADGTIYHVDPDNGSNPGDRITWAGYRFSTWGENVAAGYASPETVMRGWMNSEGHCQNLLNPAFTEVGLAYVDGGVYYNHFWTQLFARPAGEPRPPGTFDPAWC